MALKGLKRSSRGSVREPQAPKPSVPATSSRDGAIMLSAGKYARNAVLGVFDQLGGEAAMSAWAAENQTDFYTKLFSKVITKEVEDVQAADSLERLLERLDKDERVIDIEAEDA